MRPQAQFHHHEHPKLVGRSKSSNVDPMFSKCTYRRVFLISHASMSSIQALVVTNFYPCFFKVQQLDLDYFLDFWNNNLRFETGSQELRQSRHRSTPGPESNINDVLPRLDLKFRLTSGPLVHHENVMSLQILERSKSIYVLFTETCVLSCLHKQLYLISQNLNNISEYACSTNRLLRFRQSCSTVAQYSILRTHDWREDRESPTYGVRCLRTSRMEETCECCEPLAKVLISWWSWLLAQFCQMTPLKRYSTSQHVV